jgi:hypothetical protein
MVDQGTHRVQLLSRTKVAAPDCDERVSGRDDSTSCASTRHRSRIHRESAEQLAIDRSTGCP